jgi:hypothetical protein
VSQRIGWVCTDTSLGRVYWRVIVLRAATRSFCVRTTCKSKMPKRGWVERGTEVWVPKYSVTFLKPPGRSGQIL